MKFEPDSRRGRAAASVDGNQAVLSVEDNGPGVAVALRDAIFERFQRGDDGTARRFGGTGLGLAIAKELVEQHSGRIEVVDGAAGGALFRVMLPLSPGEPTAALPADRPPPAAGRAPP